MGKLADLAKTSKLKGSVTVTDTLGQSRTYADEAEAEKACEGIDVEHKRGGFFHKAKAADTADAAETKPVSKKK